MNELSADKLAILEVVENWVLYRRCRRLGALCDRVARRWLDDCHLVPGLGGGFHRCQPGALLMQAATSCIC